MKVKCQRSNVKGQGFLTLIAAVFIGILLFLVMGFVIYVGNVRRASVVITNSTSARTLADTGLEMAVWKLNNVSAYDGEGATAFGDGEIDINITDIDSKNKNVEVIAYIPNKNSPKITKIAKVRAVIDSDIVSFNYAVQAGNGGFEIGNNSIINGNVYSNGPVNGSGGVRIEGDAFSAGPEGEIEDLTVGGDAHAHQLEDCAVEGDAYYQEIEDCSVTGSSNDGSPDPEPIELPISQEQIDTWKAEAEAGGVTEGSVSISGTQTLGPRKITGSMQINNNAILILAGPVWVAGSVSTGNGVQIKLDPSYVNDSEVFIISGRFSDGNNTQYFGSGTEGSNLVIISESASLDAGSPAIEISNNADSAIFYARDGLISLKNNVNIKEVTAYKIKIGKNVILEYESGLQNVNFTSGPGASWIFSKGTYIIN